MKRSWIENMSEMLGLIPKISHRGNKTASAQQQLAYYPDSENWNDFQGPDPTHYKDGGTKNFSLVPTTCFNCESACGLLAYIDKESGKVNRFEGNPLHPATTSATCTM